MVIGHTRSRKAIHDDISSKEHDKFSSIDYLDAYVLCVKLRAKNENTSWWSVGNTTEALKFGKLSDYFFTKASQDREEFDKARKHY